MSTIRIVRWSDAYAQAFIDLTGVQRLSAMAVGYRQFSRENAELYKVIIALPAYEDDGLKEDSHETVQKVYEALSAFPLTEQQKIMYARAFRSSIHGFISLEMAGYFREGTSIDESYRFLVRNMLRGLNEDEADEINE